MKYVTTLARMRKEMDSRMVTTPTVSPPVKENLNQPSEFFTPRGKYDLGLPLKQVVGGNSEPTTKSKPQVGIPDVNVARGDIVPSAENKSTVGDTMPEWAKLQQLSGKEANNVKFESFPTAQDSEHGKETSSRKLQAVPVTRRRPSCGSPKWMKNHHTKNSKTPEASKHWMLKSSGWEKSCKEDFRGKSM